MFKTCIVVISLFFSFIVAADTLPLYPGATEIQRKVSFENDHIIALSKNRKVNGKWRFDQVQHFQGVLVKTLYEVNAEDDVKNIVIFYNAFFKNAAVTLLFSCQGRYCGSSNEWANSTFKESRLYGVDDNQTYWVVKNADVIWVLYLIRRGNDRIYWYVEELQAENLASLQLLAQVHSCEQFLLIDGIKDFLQDKLANYFLIVQMPGINTVLASQQLSDDCMQKLQLSYPEVKLHSLGLGEFDRASKRRVDELTLELLRIDK